MLVLEDMLLTLQELFMLPSARLRPMLSIPPMEWVILDMLDTLVMVLLILDMQLLLFIMLLHMLPLFIMLLDMESPMLLTLLVFTALLLLYPSCSWCLCRCWKICRQLCWNYSCCQA